MYELELIKTVEKMPVFSLADVAKITKSRNYAKKLLSRLTKRKIIKKIMRDMYTTNDDLFLIAPFLYTPSYISCASALQYHGLISQIPNAIFLMTPKRSKKIRYKMHLLYQKTNKYFGFQMVKYQNIWLPIADPEKAFIDSIGIHPLNLIYEALDELNPKKLMLYAKKTDETKRIGYLFEKNNIQLKLPKKLSYKYIYLDPLGAKTGEKNKKWRLIINS